MKRSTPDRFLKSKGLPQKVCAACGRPFAWRRKWARDWEAVRYCSDRCRRQGRMRPGGHGATA
ncbi:DUF2256 domain-containing protein [Zhengella mangrovi]|uniref:DUF2256 domain-containing protein n=1 Tax=Zhengella mangrovi TaxID=1982044 RepID=UPI00197B5A6F|nr:DUF2256 domain-containing protein [Zhengella mangrovi]